MRIIAGKYKGKKIIPPTSVETRPTSDRAREMIFNVLLHNPAFGPPVLLNKAVLDVFAGTGAFGLEAFSRGAKPVFFIENNPLTLPTLRANLKDFQIPSSCIFEKDAKHLDSAPFPFDLIFLDPPYGKNLLEPTLYQLFSLGWLRFNSIVVMELGKDESFSPPPFLSPLSERSSGAAHVLFCRVSVGA